MAKVFEPKFEVTAYPHFLCPLYLILKDGTYIGSEGAGLKISLCAWDKKKVLISHMRARELPLTEESVVTYAGGFYISRLGMDAWEYNTHSSVVNKMPIDQTDFEELARVFIVDKDLLPELPEGIDYDFTQDPSNLTVFGLKYTSKE